MWKVFGILISETFVCIKYGIENDIIKKVISKIGNLW